MSSTRKDESVSRGQTIRTETGPERENKLPQVNQGEALSGGKLAGGDSDLGYMLSGNKVKRADADGSIK